MNPLDPLRGRAYEALERIEAQLRQGIEASRKEGLGNLVILAGIKTITRETKNLTAVLAELELRKGDQLANAMRSKIRGGDFEDALMFAGSLRKEIVHAKPQKFSLLSLVPAWLRGGKTLVVVNYQCPSCHEQIPRNTKICPYCKTVIIL